MKKIFVTIYVKDLYLHSITAILLCFFIFFPNWLIDTTWVLENPIMSEVLHAKGFS